MLRSRRVGESELDSQCGLRQMPEASWVATTVPAPAVERGTENHRCVQWGIRLLLSHGQVAGVPFLSACGRDVGGRAVEHGWKQGAVTPVGGDVVGDTPEVDVQDRPSSSLLCVHAARITVVCRCGREMLVCESPRLDLVDGHNIGNGQLNANDTDACCAGQMSASLNVGTAGVASPVIASLTEQARRVDSAALSPLTGLVLGCPALY